MELFREDGGVATSEVVSITPGSPGELLGVKVGCTVVSINGQPFRSQADIVMALKFSARPITVRFRFSL